MKSFTTFGWAWIAVSLLAITGAELLGWIAFLPLGIAGITALSLATLSLLFRSKAAYEAHPTQFRVQEGNEFSIVVTPLGLETKGLEVLQPIVPVGTQVWRIPLNTPDKGESKKWTKQFPSTKRGIITIGPISLERTDTFRLVSKNSKQLGTSHIFVTPKFVELPEWKNPVNASGEDEAAAGFSKQELSYDQLREYIPGDDSRTIHWPSSAKTGQLIVREFEETKLSRMLILLDANSNSYKNPDDFELAVRIAASIANREISSKRDVKILTGNALTSLPGDHHTPQPQPVHEIASMSTPLLLESLSRVSTSENSPGFLKFTNIAVRMNRSISSLVIITGGQISPALIHEAAGIAPRGAFSLSLTCDSQLEMSFKQEGTLSRINIDDLGNLRQLLRFRAGH